MFVTISGGRVARTVAAPAGGDPFIAGLRYSGGALCIQGAAPPASAPRSGGIARDDQGVMYVSLESTPGTACYNGGVLCDVTGTVYGTVNNAIAGYSQGMPVDTLGRICFA
jgi:hypothetical protein